MLSVERRVSSTEQQKKQIIKLWPRKESIDIRKEFADMGRNGIEIQESKDEKRGFYWKTVQRRLEYLLLGTAWSPGWILE